MSAIFPLPAAGALEVKVLALGDDPQNCVPVSLLIHGEVRTVYHHDCLGHGSGPVADPYFFLVRVTNRSGGPQYIVLSSFDVRSSDGTSVQALDASTAGATPTRYFPASITLGPDAGVKGWVAFDGSSGFAPESLRYAGDAGSFVVRFRGPWQAA